MTEHFFPFDLDRRWSPLFKLLGVTHRDGVTVKPSGATTIAFGRWKVQTDTDNIVHTVTTGPHRWWTAVGLRLSFADDGLTFGTNHHAGLCIEFREKIPRVIGPRDHSSLWLSVADPAGLATALAAPSEG